MNESGTDPTRRRVLRYCVAGSVAGLAGCLGDDSVGRAEEIAEQSRYERTLTAEHHDRVVMLEYET